MKIGLLVLSVRESEQNKYYNTQDIGLAKALSRKGYEVVVYKLIAKKQDEKREIIEGTSDATVCYLPTRSIGNNGLPNTKLFDKSIDVLICFSDIQLAVPAIYRWTQKNKITFYPYIGVIESHSINAIKKNVMNILFWFDLQVYRKCKCLIKTPAIHNVLLKKGVKEGIVAPVGLDLDLLKTDYAEKIVADIKAEYEYQPEDKVLLFVGRLTVEKQPIRMIEIFSEIRKKDKNYQLLIVGEGELKDQVIKAINDNKLDEYVKLMERIPNKDIWKLYRLAECFVNLNQHEIFGMALLEAMYYECKVVAWKSPGPEFIIEDGISGYLVETDDQVVEKILDKKFLSKQAHERIVQRFTWANTVEIIEQLI